MQRTDIKRKTSRLYCCFQLYIRYSELMTSRKIIQSNPFLSDKSDFSSRLVTCVSSSTAIETGEQVKRVEERLNRFRSSQKRSAVKLA